MGSTRRLMLLDHEKPCACRLEGDAVRFLVARLRVTQSVSFSPLFFFRLRGTVVPMMSSHPSEFHPGLTDERLQVLARIFADAARGALESHDPDSGEGAWSLGCRRYERICAGIVRASTDHPWLTFFQSNLYFLIRIDGLPIKFFRGDPMDPPDRAKRELPRERQFRQSAFKFALPPEPGRHSMWRVSFETDLEGEVYRVTLIRTTKSGKVMNFWDIPVTESVASLAPVVPLRPEFVDVDAPSVGLKRRIDLEEENATE